MPVANQVVVISSRLGGSATKGIPDEGRVSILVDLPANRESDFRNAVASTQGGGSPESSAPTESPEPGSIDPGYRGEKKLRRAGRRKAVKSD